MHGDQETERIAALAVLRMSSSASRYRPTSNRKVQLHERILMLAQRYRCYGVGVIYLKLRQDCS